MLETSCRGSFANRAYKQTVSEMAFHIGFHNRMVQKVLSIDEMVGSDALTVVRPHGAYLLGILCSVIQFITVESLSLFYLLFMS